MPSDNGDLRDQFTVEHKEDESPLTKADLASHEIIVEGLGRLFPDIPICRRSRQFLDMKKGALGQSIG